MKTHDSLSNDPAIDIEALRKALYAEYQRGPCNADRAFLLSAGDELKRLASPSPPPQREMVERIDAQYAKSAGAGHVALIDAWPEIKRLLSGDSDSSSEI